MEAVGGSCLPPAQPQPSALVGPPATADPTESNSNTKAGLTRTDNQAKTMAETPYAAIPHVLGSNDDVATNKSQARGHFENRKRDHRRPGRRGQLQKGSTVSTAWDALVDTFAQCYFTLRRDERGCHALSPPLPVRTIEGGSRRKNGFCVCEPPEGTPSRGDRTPQYTPFGGSEKNVRCVRGTAGAELAKTHAAPGTSYACSAGVAAAPAANVQALTNQQRKSDDVNAGGGVPADVPATVPAVSPFERLALGAEMNPGALTQYCLSTHSGAKIVDTQEQVTSTLSTVFTSVSHLSNAERQRRSMPAGEDGGRVRREGIVSDARVLDKLTRHMIAELQYHFAVNNGAVSAAEFVYIFKRLFRQYNQQSRKTAATSAAGPLAKVATIQSKTESAEGNEPAAVRALEQQQRQPGLTKRSDIFHEKSDYSSGGSKPAAAVTSAGECFQPPQEDTTTEDALVEYSGGDLNEVGHTLEVPALNWLHHLSAGEQLGIQHKQEQELLEEQQFLNVFALIDVNDNDAITWEEFTRFIIDRGRNEDTLNRLHLQRLEGRDIRESRIHVSPVESLTVAYDPPFALDLVFYFEENSKTVEILTPDSYPSGFEQPTAPSTIQCPQQGITTRLFFPSEKEDVIPLQGTLALPAASGSIPAPDSLLSVCVAQDSIPHQRFPLTDPIRHNFTIVAIAYCPSVHHLAVAAADLSLSFYDVKLAGKTEISRRHSSNDTDDLSPVNNHFSPIAAANDRRGSGAGTGGEGRFWKLTRSFKTRTSQIVLYPSPGRPLLFSADHEGSIYAWDLLRICRAESADSTADPEHYWWTDSIDGLGNEPAPGACGGGVNANIPPSLTTAAPTTPRSTLYAAPTDLATEAHIPGIKSRRRGTRFDSDVTASAPIDLGALIPVNSAQQQPRGRGHGISSTADSCVPPAAAKGRVKTRRAKLAAGSETFPSPDLLDPKSVALVKDIGRGPAPSVPPLKLPLRLHAEKEAVKSAAAIGGVKEQLQPVRNKAATLESVQTIEGGSAGCRNGSSRTDLMLCDPPSSLNSSNGGRSLSSAARSVGFVCETGRELPGEPQHGCRHPSGVQGASIAVSSAHSGSSTVGRLHRGMSDNSAPNLSGEYSPVSTSATKELSSSFSSCSSSSRRTSHWAANQQIRQFAHHQRRQKACIPGGTPTEDFPPATSASSSCTAPPDSSHTAARSGNDFNSEHDECIPRLTRQDQQKRDISLQKLKLHQQSFTSAEHTEQTYLPRDGRSASSTRTLIGVPGACTWSASRLGAATSVPSEPQSHLLRWRQVYAHSDIVSGFQELEGGTDMLASCGMDKRIIIWTASTGEQKRVLEGHARGIRALCFDVESRVLLSGGFDYKLFVWNPYVGKKVHTIRGHSAPVVSICMLAGGGSCKRQFLSCDSEGIVKTWDMSSSACLQTLLTEDLLPSSGGHLRALVPLPHRQMLLAAAGRKLVALVYGSPTGSLANSHSNQPFIQNQSRPHRTARLTYGSSSSCSTAPSAGAGEVADPSGAADCKSPRKAGPPKDPAGAKIAPERRGKSMRAGTVTKLAGMGASKKRTSASIGLYQDCGKFAGLADICKGLPREGEPLTKAVAHADVRVLVTAGATHLRVWDLCTGVLISTISHDCRGCSSGERRGVRRDGCGNAVGGTCESRSSEAIASTGTQGGQPTGQRGNRMNDTPDNGTNGRRRSHSDLNSKSDAERRGSAPANNSSDTLPKGGTLAGESNDCSNVLWGSEVEGAHVITDICLDRSGRKVFVADHFGCLCAYSVCTGQMVRRLAPHAAEISHLVYAEEDRNLISVSWDRSIVVHNDALSSVCAAAASPPSLSSQTAASLAPQHLHQHKENNSSLRALTTTAGKGAVHAHASSSGNGEPITHDAAPTDARKQTHGAVTALQESSAASITADTPAHGSVAAASLLMKAQEQSVTNNSNKHRDTEFHHPSTSGTSLRKDSNSNFYPRSFLLEGCGRSVPGALRACKAGVEEEREEVMNTIWRRVDNAHLGDVTCCAYSRRLGLLATGSVDKAIFVWNYERLRRVACLFGHREDVAVLSFADPLPFLCSADLGGTICIWVLPPHPRAVRVLEVQSAALSGNGRISLPAMTDTETPTPVRSSPQHSYTAGGTLQRGAPGELMKRETSAPGGTSCNDSPVLSSQGPCSRSNTTSYASSGFKTSSGRESLLVNSNICEISRSSRRGAGAAELGGRQLRADTGTSPARTSPVGKEQNKPSSCLSDVYSPQACSSSPLGSFSAGGEYVRSAAGYAGASSGTRKCSPGATEASDPKAMRTDCAPQDTSRSQVILENSGGEPGRCPLSIGTDAIDDRGRLPSLLLLMIEDMENLTGAPPVVALAALCRRRKRKGNGHLSPLPLSRHALPLLEYEEERQQQQHPSLPASSSSLYLPAVPYKTNPSAPGSTTAEKSDECWEGHQVSAEGEGEQHMGHTKKCATFITSGDAVEPCSLQKTPCLSFPARREQVHNGQKNDSSNSRNMVGSGYGSSEHVARQTLVYQPEQLQHVGSRRPTRKKNRGTHETATRLRLQQEEEAAAARDARWPLQAEFLLFAGDEKGRVRVWDVSFLLRQLKGTRYIHKKKEWNPYRIWREELKESTLNIFRERVLQQRQLQQHLTRIVEQEEQVEEEARAQGPAAGGTRGQTPPGGYTGSLRPGGGTAREEVQAASQEATSTAAFSLPTRRHRKKTHDPATAQGTHHSSNCRHGKSGAISKAQRSLGLPSESPATTDADQSPFSPYGAPARKELCARDDSPTKKESRFFGTCSGSGLSSPCSPVALGKEHRRFSSGRWSATGEPARLGNTRRGVSFVEVNDETIRSGSRPLPQHSERHGSHSSAYYPHQQKNSRLTAEEGPLQTAGKEVATVHAKESGDQPSDSAFVRLAYGGAFRTDRRTTSISKMSPAAGGVEGEEEEGREVRTNVTYAGGGSCSDKGTTETVNACSNLLSGIEATPFFLRAPVRLVASWQAHRDGLKSMQLLPLRSKKRRCLSATASGILAGGAHTTAAPAARTDAVAVSAASVTSGAETHEGSPTAALNPALTETSSGLQLRKHFGRRPSGCGKRLLLLTAGGDGAARIWDISRISSDVAMPALFLDKAEGESAERRDSSTSRCHSWLTTGWPRKQPGEDALRSSPFAASSFASAVTASEPYALVPLRSGNGVTRSATGLGIQLYPQQHVAQPATQPSENSLACKTAFPHVQHQVFLVGDLHAQSSNAVAAAAAGKSGVAEEAAAVRGLKFPHPRRLWLLDLDRDEDLSVRLPGSFLDARDVSSSEDSKTDDDSVAHARLLQLHMQVKELETEHQQISARRAKLDIDPALLPNPVLACLSKDEPTMDLPSDDIDGFASAERRGSSSSNHSSNSSSAC